MRSQCASHKSVTVRELAKQACSIWKLITYRSLSSDEDSDCVIKSGRHVFLAHKLVLRQCTFFAAAFKHGWLEAKNSTVVLQEDEPNLVARLILCLYTSIYPEQDVNDSKIAQESPIRIIDPHYVGQHGSDTHDWVVQCHLHLRMATLGDKIRSARARKRSISALRRSLSWFGRQRHFGIHNTCCRPAKKVDRSTRTLAPSLLRGTRL